MSLTQIMIFLPIALLVAASPGANNLLAFISATKAGWQRAATAVLGRIAAWAVLVVLISFGLDVILRTSETAFITLKWCGVAYLGFLAWKFWNAETSSEFMVPDTTTLAQREFFTLLGNPKAYLLLTAFLPQFVDGAFPIMFQLLMLGGLYIAVEGLAAMIWVTSGALVGARALTPLRRKLINRISAGLMGSAAVLLAKLEKVA